MKKNILTLFPTNVSRIFFSLACIAIATIFINCNERVSNKPEGIAPPIVIHDQIDLRKKQEAPAASKPTPPVKPAMEGTKEMSKEEKIKHLTDLQRRVTQEEATEPPFKNEYWNNKKEGLYVDIVSGKPLFSSKDKFESDCGWPSFAKPLEEKNVGKKTDYKLIYPRTEVHSVDGSHLGHVFNDGPRELGGLRYCINSASLRFIPKEDLEKEGYPEYKKLFE